jgi:hypothetical protein
MALQPRDRQKMKHKMSLAPSLPKLVNRSHKTLLLEMKPELLTLEPKRFNRYYYWNY